MRIIADETTKNILSGHFVEKEHENFTIVYLERLDERNQRTRFIGFDDVLKLAPEDYPILMLGLFSPLWYARENPKWHAALAYPKVAFRQLPVATVQMLVGLKEAESSTRLKDPLALALLEAKEVQSQIGILNHDLANAQRQGGAAMGLWQERAKKVLGDKTEDELVRMVTESAKEGMVAGQFDGQKFPDACIDLEGTLFDLQGQVRPDVLALVEDLSKSRPITLWSGGDLKKLNAMLTKAQIPYKLASKGLMRGAKVGVVIDDLSEVDFQQTYGIKYGEYIKA